jgi:hypothetical protein
MSEYTVWKFVLPLEDNPQVDMPSEAYVLSVDQQHGQLCVWALVDTSAPSSTRTFAIRGTGHPTNDIEQTNKFLGTVLMANGNLVFHVWETS